MKKLYSFFFIISFINIYAQSHIGWKTDLLLVKEQLPKKHYNFSELENTEKFDVGIDSLIKNYQNLKDVEVAIKLQEHIASLGDSHTGLNYSKLINRKALLPIQLYWFNEGLYVMKTANTYKRILGKKLISINNIPLDDVVKRLSKIFTVDNNAMLKNNIPNLLPSIQLLNYYGIVKGKYVTLEFVDENGILEKVTMTPKRLTRDDVVFVSFRPKSVPFVYKNQKKWFKAHYFNKGGVCYIQYNKCWSKEVEEKYGNVEKALKMPSFKPFLQEIKAVFKAKKISKLVIDLRFNGGGNSQLGKEFAQFLASRLKEKKGVRVYVVLGRKTFSSAILNALHFKKYINAVFIGEETAGKPSHFGEVRKISLPNSKLTLNYSTKCFNNASYSKESTLNPEYKIYTSFNMFKEGKDDVFEWVLKQ